MKCSLCQSENLPIRLARQEDQVSIDLLRRYLGMNLRKKNASISRCVLTALLSLFLVLLSASCSNKEVSKNRQLSQITLKFREKLQVLI